MTNTEEVVFLEDIEPRNSKTVIKNVTSTSTVTSTKAGTVKRQRTLVDMFSSSQEMEKSSSPPKKQKLSSSASATTPSAKMTFGRPKLNSIPFSLSKFQDSLTEEKRDLLRLECECMAKGWLKMLTDEIKKPYFVSLKRFLWEEGVRGPNEIPQQLKVYPSPRDIYSWSNTPLGKIKVVIIGQDPYHNRGQAHGLCFSVPKGIPVPPSLKNIYTELQAEYPNFVPPKHGNLTEWASNGVLMLNTCLTVRANSPGSHSNKGWEEFTDKIVDVIDKYGGANLPIPAGNSTDSSGIGRGVVFLAWGSWAAKRVAKLDKGKHLILQSAHPSPYSAHKGFLGNGHFKAANAWLEAKYGPEGKVDWCCISAE